MFLSAGPGGIYPRHTPKCVVRNPHLLVQSILIATYIIYKRRLQASLSVPSVKQHLAAIRMLFDYLVVGQYSP